MVRQKRLYSSITFRNLRVLTSIIWSHLCRSPRCDEDLQEQLPLSSRKTSSLSPARQGPLQLLLRPSPLHPHVIHGPSVQPEPLVDQSPTPVNMTACQLPDAPTQLLLANRRHRYCPALSVVVLHPHRQA